MKMGDLSTLKADREVFKTKVLEAYPDKKPRAIPTKKHKEVSAVSGLRGRWAQVRFLRGIPVTCCNLLYLHAVNWRHPLVLNSARR